jgi:GNAT superfamily N-acetyltransferase
MNKLLCILFFSNLSLISSEPTKRYAKEDKSWIRYYDEHLRANKAGANSSEPPLSQLTKQENATNKLMGFITYDPANCWISCLFVEEEYRKSGIGTKLAKEALEDMRTNYNCQTVALKSFVDATKFWEKLGAQPIGSNRYVFHNSSSQNFDAQSETKT